MLEDMGKTAFRVEECSNCGYEDDQEGTHFLDSETFSWECEKCRYLNTVNAPIEDDPDYYVDLALAERH